MNRMRAFDVLILTVLLWSACGPAVEPSLPDTPTPAPTRRALPVAPTPIPLPLSTMGPYTPGKTTFTTQDPARGNREVSITVWYPAIRPADGPSDPYYVGTDLAPDPAGAPYPLLISSTTMAKTMARLMVSHGFVWASVDHIDTYFRMQYEMYSQPLDILFALDRVATDPPAALAGLIDADHVGAIGYSFDGYNTLAMSGARVDPDYYRAQCPEPDATTAAVVSEMSAYGCDPAEDWAAFEAGAGAAITASEDGLWQPMTDPRIRAVMPMACEGWWLFGARGLAAVDRPVLMLAGTEDGLYAENV